MIKQKQNNEPTSANVLVLFSLYLLIDYTGLTCIETKLIGMISTVMERKILIFDNNLKRRRKKTGWRLSCCFSYKLQFLDKEELVKVKV
ncbi:hypothetical protein Lalb_Chr09g0326681 [Lupinus albus]|uniref:Uncharacterized protein n=1 Tax=Lupinus albus TaxID=3870 RepID=A0A6A4PZX5_LUPAL|nr:hypothetical protein Lalb_Chr09g0326681 [Lupinus albus]